MEKKEKKQIEKIAKKLQDEVPEDRVSGLEIHTVELPPEPEIKDKKHKGKTKNATKTKTDKKPDKGKPAEQRKPGKEGNEVHERGQGGGGKAEIPGPAPPGGRERLTLGGILERIMPPWW